MTRRGPGGHVEEIVLLLTAGCNLACTYCYQNARKPGAMEWPTLRAALDLLLASPDRRAVSFAGGEPTLQFALVRRAVDYLSRRAGDRPLVFHLVTNGLLLHRRDVAFLASHDFRLELSFDGVAAAQNERAVGSFDRLDTLLDALRTAHPGYFQRRVALSMTIARGTTPHLAESFGYFLSKGVREVAIHPAMGQAEWSDGDLEPLDGQLSQVVRLSLEHYRRTHEIPFARFRRRTVSRRPHARAWGCSAPLGKALSVDVDGQVYPCALFARSYQAFAPGIDERVRLLSMGDVRDPLLPGRLAALPDACRASGLFAPKRLQHSGERACATCRERSHCVICPVARVKRSSADDVNDIPRYLCTCERILGAHRRHFLAQAPPSSGEALLLTLLSERRTAEPTSKPSRSPLRPTAP